MKNLFVGIHRVRMSLMRVLAETIVRVLVRRRIRLNPGLNRGRNHIHFGCGQPAAAHLAHLKARADVELGCRFFKKRKGNARIHQGAQQHIAADAGKTLKISNSHRQAILEHSHRSCNGGRSIPP
jgi:hypothetical protein